MASREKKKIRALIKATSEQWDIALAALRSVNKSLDKLEVVVAEPPIKFATVVATSKPPSFLRDLVALCAKYNVSMVGQMSVGPLSVRGAPPRLVDNVRVISDSGVRVRVWNGERQLEDDEL